MPPSKKAAAARDGLPAAILDALPANIALLSPTGEILAVNEAWRKFGEANALQGTDFFVGQNYLEICDRVEGECAAEARLTADGIRRLLRGDSAEFSLEYACHSPAEKRWYRVMVAPLRSDEFSGVAVMHLNVTERRLAEESVRQREQEHRQLVRQLEEEKSRLVEAQSVAKVGSWETDLTTMAVHWSDETHHIFGTDPATFVPSHEAFLARVHPDDRAAVAAAFDRSRQEATTNKIEHRIVLPDGSIKNVEERWRAYQDAGQRPVRAIGTCRDITERKRSQAERELMFNLSADLMSITRFDGPLEQVNPAWTRVLGWSSLELIGRPSLDFVLPEDRDATIKARAGLLAGKPLRNLENRYRCKDGSYRWLSWNSEPLLETRQVFAVARDITEQKSALTKLQQAQALSRMASRLARIGAWQLEIASNELTWSDGVRALHETPPDYIPSVDTAIDFYAPEAREPIRQAVAVCISQGLAFDQELPFITAAGKHLWVRVIGEAVRDDHGGVVQVRGALQDITERRRAEEQSRQLADRLTTTLESITDAFLTVDRDWCFTFLNREAERLLGRPRTELIGRDIWECFPEAIGSAIEREYRRALAENRSVAFEEFYAPLHIWFAIRAFPSENGLAVYFRDVTARVQAERELARTHRALRMLSRCNEALIRAENEQRLLQDICEIATGIGGFRLAWVGYALDDESKSIVPQAHAGMEDGYLSSIQLSWSAEKSVGNGPAGRAIRTGAPVVVTDLGDPAAGFVYLTEARNRGYHGVVCLPLKDGTHVFGVLALYLDNSRPVPAEELDLLQELAEDLAFGIRNLRADLERRRQAALLDKAQDAIIVRDLDHRVTFWNRSAERLYGWTVQEALGRRVRELIFFDQGIFDATMEKLLAEGEWSGEFVHVRKDGQKLDIESRWTLVRDDHGQPKSVLAINTDVTERKQLERQFLRAQRMESIGTLASGIAHDLNNVLAPILMSVALLKLKVPDNQDVHRQLDQLATNTERGANLVRHLLAFGRGFVGERIPLQPKHIAREIAELVEDTFPKNIEFEFTYKSDLWSIVGDPTQLHQILLNLCVNARDAMPGGGRLGLHLENVQIDEPRPALQTEAKPGLYVVLTVSDTGTGIPAHILDKIFDPFFTTKEPGKGTGLGLSTTLAIVRNHGGFLELESKEGTGTTFRVYLPANRADVPATTSLKPAQLAGRNELVLVVDDEQIIREVARRVLEKFGYQVLLAVDGTDAVRQYALHHEKIAVVVTDMAMPVMDGPATILALRGINPNVKIIASSGHTVEAAQKEAGAAGANIAHFISKPYTAEQLLEAVRRLIEENSRAPF